MLLKLSDVYIIVAVLLVSDLCSSLYFVSSAAETDNCNAFRAKSKSFIVTTSWPPQSSSVRPEDQNRKYIESYNPILPHLKQIIQSRF